MLSGCALFDVFKKRDETGKDTVTVKVPVAVMCPAAPAYTYPSLPIEEITDKSKDNEIIYFYSLTVDLLKSEIKSLNKLLDGYRCTDPKDDLCKVQQKKDNQ